MGGEAGAVHIERIDAKMDLMPGMEGLHLLRRSVAKYGVGPGVADIQSPAERIQAIGRRIGESGRAKASKLAGSAAALPTGNGDQRELASSTS